MRKKDQSAQNWSADLGFLLMAACCLVLFDYVLFVQSVSSFNWFVVILLVAACPLMHLFMHRGGRHY